MQARSVAANAMQPIDCAYHRGVTITSDLFDSSLFYKLGPIVPSSKVGPGFYNATQ